MKEKNILLSSFFVDGPCKFCKLCKVASSSLTRSSFKKINIRKEFSVPASWNGALLNKHRKERIFVESSNERKRRNIFHRGGVVNSMEISKSLADWESHRDNVEINLSLVPVPPHDCIYIHVLVRIVREPIPFPAKFTGLRLSPVQEERSRPNPSCQRIMKTFRRDETHRPCISLILAPLSPPSPT